MQKINPCLWFNDNAEEAVHFYTSTFKGSKILNTTRYSKEVSEVAGRPAGSVMTIEFEIEGQKFLALNGGPVFQFSPAISLMVQCETQQEIDQLWDKLSAGGAQEQCGWLKDRFGVSWQIVPAILQKMVTDKDTTKANRVMAALMPMKKLDIAALKRAFEGQ
jgi:predicted 3-demethylubiquinone-9 3-methyltransferase (glyoxalase superfamily)